MKVESINHITLPVSNLQKSFDFYKNILGIKPLVKWERGAYFLCGDFWFCLSLDQSDRDFSVQDYRHLAFSVSKENFIILKKKLIDFGCNQWSENKSEGDSFYFRDPDGHNLEIHVGDWKSRIESVKNNPWEGEIEFFV